jgi:zinc transport system ATP-binding protein
MTPPLVSIRNLRVTLGGRPVLDGIDADVARGKISALIGLNGSGKTTMLRALVKEIPYEGAVRFHCGHDHTRPAPQHVGYVPQRLRIEASLPVTVADLLGLAMMRWPLFLGISAKLRRRMVDLLARVWLTPDVLERPVEKISGGELQRVLLALALDPHPELLLLDEPAAGIDFRDIEPFYDLLSRLNHEMGVTILLVSHDLSVVSKHADHVLCLRDGRIQCQGTPKEVLTRQAVAETFGASSGVFAHHHGH